MQFQYHKPQYKPLFQLPPTQTTHDNQRPKVCHLNTSNPN
nr:MAG TPA: hypothetical protein [Caudoviricetes sp.]